MNLKEPGGTEEAHWIVISPPHIKGNYPLHQQHWWQQSAKLTADQRRWKVIPPLPHTLSSTTMAATMLPQQWQQQERQGDQSPPLQTNNCRCNGSWHHSKPATEDHHIPPLCTSDDPTKIKSDISQMFDSLWADNEWSHSSQFTSVLSPEHAYFDDKWDITRKFENLNQRCVNAMCQLNRAYQRHSCIKQWLGLSKKAHPPTLNNNGLPSAQSTDGSSNTNGKTVSLKSLDTQVSKGAPSKKRKSSPSTSASASSQSWINRKKKANRKGKFHQMVLNDFTLSLGSKTDKEISSPYTSKAINQTLERPHTSTNVRNDFLGNTIPNIISQLCSLDEHKIDGVPDEALPSQNTPLGFPYSNFLESLNPLAFAAGS